MVVCLLALGLCLPVGLGAVPRASAATLDVGYRDSAYSAALTSPTAEKPQSKLWYADGRWWAVLWDNALGRFAIHGFNLATQATNAWTSTKVTVDSRPNSQADVLWDNAGKKLYVVTHDKGGSASSSDIGLKVLRFGYSAGTYTLEDAHVVVNRKVEAAVIDKDSTGRLWVTYADYASGDRLVRVAHTTTSDTTWTAPFTLPVSATAVRTSADDISTLVAYGDADSRKIGVLWSNQKTSALYFASHVDGAADSAWSLTTLCSAARCPDDHLNIKSVDADASGHLYAIVKTSLDDKTPREASDPLIVLYRLNPSGSWSSSTAWTVGEGRVTRAIVVLDSQNRQVHAFASGPCCSGGTIWTKEASFDTIAFPRGNGTVFMRSAVSSEGINNPTSTKQTVNAASGLLVLASINSTHEYVHNYLALGGTSPPSDTDPPTVVGTSPVGGAVDVPVASSVSATFSEALDPASVSTSSVTLSDAAGTPVAGAVGYNASSLQVTLDPALDLAAGASYTVRIAGGVGGVRDAAGNAMTADKVWSFTPAAGAPTGGPVTVGMSVSDDSYVSSDAPGTNYGNSPVMKVDSVPLRVGYLKFDLSAYAGKSLVSAELRLRSGGSGGSASAGIQTVRRVADDSWTESALTYSNLPALGSTALGSLGPTKASTDYRIPLALSSADADLGGILSLGLDSSHWDGLDITSGETSTPPTLFLVLQ